MRKAWILVIALVAILILLIPLFLNYYYTNASYKEFQVFIASFPRNDGIKIFCLENNSRNDCTERTTFFCGERIELVATVKNVSTPFYACMNMSFFGMPLVCSPNKTLSPFLFYEPNVTIPKAIGKVQLIEIYWFPPKNYSTIEDFIADMNSSKKIMSLERNIVC